MTIWRSVRVKSALLRIFSTLIVPTALLMAQAPQLSLPTTPVTGVQTATTSPTYSTMAISGIGSGYSITNATYNAWCTDPNGFIPSEILNLSTMTLFDPTGAAQYQTYSSYASNLPNDGNAGTAGDILNSQTALTVQQEWQIVNYVINFRQGLNGTIPTTMMDVQAVIWQVLRPQDEIDYLTQSYTDQYAAQLYSDAIQNGIGFIPQPGQLIAVVLDPITPQNSPEPYQGTFIQIPVPTPNICLKKCARVSKADCFEQVTYYYTVTNTGNVTLTNIVVKDDNGTPNYSNDDFVVGTIPNLAPSASITLTHQTYLPITEYAVDSRGNANWSTLIPVVLPNGNLQITFLQDEDIIDNTYGNSSSGGWLGQSNNFAEHLGSDSAEFQFTDGRGNVVLDFSADYVSQSKQYPSGYGTAGVWGGAGQFYWGNPSNIVNIDTTITDALNQSPSYYGNTTNSPAAVDHKWNSIDGYTVVVKAGAFGRNGFGQCNIRTVQNSRCKTGGGHYKCIPICSTVTNTATATGQAGTNLTVSATATATVQVDAPCQQTCQRQQHKCQQQQCQCQCWECQHGNHSHCQNQQCHDPNCQHNN